MQESYNHIKIKEMSSQNHPLVTIGITAFNAADTISGCLACALAQTWPNTEILIVDDCSTDATSEILNTAAQQNTQIRIVRHETNLGVATARNTLLKESKGAYIVFFDDDDVSTPDRIQKQYDRIVNYASSDFVLCHTSRRQIFPDKTIRIERTPGSDAHLPAPHGQEMFNKILFGKPATNGFGSMATCSLMMPRKVFETIGPYDANFRRCEDTDFTLRFAQKNGHFLGIEEALVTQTMTLTSEKTLLDEKKYHLDIYKKYEPFIGPAATDFGIKWLELRYAFLQRYKMKFAWKLFFLLLTHPALSTQKIFWALPNFGFNYSMMKWHKTAS